MNIRTLIDKHRTPTLTEQGKQKFGEYLRAVQNPGVLLDDLERGHVSPEVLETWTTLYPQELDEVRTLIADEVERKAATGHVFDEMEVRTLNKVMGHQDDGYLAAMQRNHQEEEQAPQGQPGAPVNISKQMPTRADQAREGRY